MHYLLNDGTESMTVIDPNGLMPPIIESGRHRPYKYYDLRCAIRPNRFLALETINEVKDSNAITNHWLNVAMASCIRKFGALSPAQIHKIETTPIPVPKSARRKSEKPASEKPALTQKEKSMLEAINKVLEKEKQPSVLHIHSYVETYGGLASLIWQLEDMVKKKILREEKGCYYPL